jgi:gliding motility-associated-like protein
MKTKLIFILLCLLCSSSAFAQNQVSIAEGDSVNILCSQGCLMLHANHPHVQQTNSYSVSTISYAPVSTVGTTVSFTNDDYFSSIIPIGFTFCFFNQSYTQLCISDNGQVTFNTSYANMPSSFATQTALPFFNNAFPDNAIFGPFIDAKLSLGGSVTYSTIGAAPNQKFVIQFNNVPYFNNGCTSSSNNNFQIILYETTNKIECHITNKEVCNTSAANWLNYSTLGIQNTNATSFYTVAGKNASVWTANNEAYLFEPNGGNNFVLEWRNGVGVLLGQQDSILYCAVGSNGKMVLSVKDNCTNYVFKDTIKLYQYKPKIDSVIVQKPMCSGMATGCLTVVANSTNPPLQYAINNGTFQASNVFCNLTAGVYSITILDGQGCYKDTTINIAPASYIYLTTVQVKPDSCPLNIGQMTVVVLGGLAPFTFLWSNGSTDSIATNLSGNINYYVLVTDANGCTKNISMSPNMYGLPLAGASNIKPICGQSNGSITLNPYGAIGPYTYLWTNGDTSSTLTNAAAGSYAVTITSANGCFNYLNFILIDTLQTILQTPKINTTCGKANGSFTINGSGGVMPYQFTVNGVSTSILTFNNLVAGTYIVTMLDSNGCLKTNNVNVASSVGPSISFNVSKPNCDSANGKVTATVTNGIGVINYLWSNGVTANTISNIDSGSYVLQVTDGVGCVKKDTIYVPKTLPPSLQIISYTAPICFGDPSGSITLAGNFGIPSYKYSIDQINYSANAQINNITGGTFTINIKDATGCNRDTIVYLAQPDSMYGIITGLYPLVCYDDAVDSVRLQGVGGSPAYTYKVDNQTFSNNPFFFNLNSGTHQYYIKDSKNCIIQKSFMVDGPIAPLQVEIIKEDIDCFLSNTGKATAAVNGGWGNYQLQWSNGSVLNSITNLSANKYTVTVADAKGCVDSAETQINQLLCCKAVLPNAFSPNGDGFNDQLFVLAISDISSLRLRIYNRFGGVVFETENIARGWDGRVGSAFCEMGTYFYLLEYNCLFKKEKIILKGDVTLVR